VVAILLTMAVGLPSAAGFSLPGQGTLISGQPVSQRTDGQLASPWNTLFTRVGNSFRQPLGPCKTQVFRIGSLTANGNHQPAMRSHSNCFLGSSRSLTLHAAQVKLQV